MGRVTALSPAAALPEKEDKGSDLPLPLNHKVPNRESSLLATCWSEST